MILMTHFDETYSAQGQLMLRSFMQHSSERFKILVLWLGDKPAISGDHNIEVIKLHQFMQYDERFFNARENRSWRAFCWTLEPALVHYCLKAQSDGEIVMYCDSDMWWLADPVSLIHSLMERSDIALSPHWFPPGKEKLSVGYWNFGIGLFRACDLTRKIVGEWLDQTLEKCDETTTDQCYLDSWKKRLGDRLEELPFGVNLGPWSLFETKRWHGVPFGDVLVAQQGNSFSPITSVHFHETRRGTGRNPVQIKGEAWNITNYEIHPSTRECVYEPYIRELERFL